jgi:signal transduction histidine kinase
MERDAHDGDLMRLLADAGDLAAFTLAPDGRVASWSAAAERVFGWPAADVVGREGALLIAPEDRDEAARTLARAGERGRADALLWHRRRATPSPTPPSGHAPEDSRFRGATLVRRLDGARGFAVLCRDLSGERAAARDDERELGDALLAGEQRVLEQLVRGVPLPTVLAALCRIVEEQSGGRARAAIMLLDPDGLRLRDGAAPSLPECYNRAVVGIAIGPEVGTCCRAAALRTPVVTPDIAGCPRWQNLRHLPLSLGLKAAWSMPIVSSTGAVLGTFGTYFLEPREPTAHERRIVEVLARIAGLAIERRRTEEELRRSEGTLRFLDSLAQATRGAAAPGDIMAITARSLAQHLGVTRCAYADVEPDEDRFTIRDDWSDGAASSAGVYSLDLFGPRAAAELRAGRTLVVRDVDAELAPGGGADMFNAIAVKAIVCCPLIKDGRLSAMMAVHHVAPRDWRADEVGLVQQVVERSWAHIERSRSEATLREVDRRKDDFMAMLAHELRNPLAPLRNALEILNLRAGDPTVVERVRAIMDRQVTHLGRLVDDLLDVVRITTGKVQLRRQRLDLGELARQAVADHRLAAEARRLVLVASAPSAPVWVAGDPTRLVQVLDNLLTNALKFTPPGGTITVEVAPTTDGRATLSVRDTGAGIEPDMLARLFEPFSQADRTLARSSGGLGLGLAIVRGLAELHGGSVRATSAGLGAGATISVTLPAHVEPPALTQGAAPAPPSPRRLRVLVVEDNRDAADSLRMLLDAHGYDVEVAYSGPDGVRAAEAHHPEVIICDLGLPGMDGYAVAGEVRNNPATARTRLIALTGYGQEDDRRRAREAGFDAHLTKPADPARLVSLLSAPG